MRSTTTIKQILADARMLVGAENETQVMPETMLTRYNTVLSAIYKQLNGALFSRFMAHAPIGTPASAIVYTASDGATYTAATKRLSVGAGFADNQEGSLVLIVDITDPYTVGVYCTYITDDQSGSGYFTVADGPTANVAATDLAYMVLQLPSSATTTFSIADHRVDKIRRMHFPLVGSGREVNADVIESYTSSPNNANGVGWSHTGTSGNPVVKRAAGTSTTNSGGYPVMFFEELPKYASSVDEYCDLPTEFHAPLIEEIARRTLLELGAQVPPMLENPLAAIDLYTETYQATQNAR